MAKPETPDSCIRLRGVRHNNLKNFDLDLPLGKLIVITGLSGSGKSSLAFDTLYAEGQRRYIETFSPYARQFFDRMDKPQVDRIEGIPPAIALEQRNTVKSTRSTVGTMTEIADYMKVLWAHLAQLHCRQCDSPVRKDSPAAIWNQLIADAGAGPREAVVTFTLPLSDKLSLPESLDLVGKQGFQRLLVGKRFVRLDQLLSNDANSIRLGKEGSLTVVQDRVPLAAAHRSRFVEACEQAYHFGKDKLAVLLLTPSGNSFKRRGFSKKLHCAECDIEYRDPTPAQFSFNHPVGACPRCRGFGRIIAIDYRAAIPNRSLTLAQGAVKPWQTGQSAECQKDLQKFCRKRAVPMNVPFDALPPEQQRWVIDGDPGYGTDPAHEWPQAWYGVKGYFRWLESKTYKMHVRVLLSRYRTYDSCPDCGGSRFRPDAQLFRVAAPRKASGAPWRLTLSQFYQLSIDDAAAFIEDLRARFSAAATAAVEVVLKEVHQRLQFLVEAGLGYLTLDRPTRTLSGGETERVNLTTCLGSGLVNTLFVLDEPTVGLHHRDTTRLVRILKRLRDRGNTVIVVEHEPAVIRAADHIVDLGPGHGDTGGSIMFQGSYADLVKKGKSLTAQYMSGRRTGPRPTYRPVTSDALNEAAAPWNGVAPAPQFTGPALRIEDASVHNLKSLAVSIPLERFVCVTGVSGSGKTTLVKNVLLPLLQEHLLRRNRAPTQEPSLGTPESTTLDPDDASDSLPETRRIGPMARLSGANALDAALMVDQSPIGKTPRSNPALYVGAFDEIRDLFASTDHARQNGLTASTFSFNTGHGRCERCRGVGFEKIEMQFLSDIFIRCPDCDGRRFRPHVLEATITLNGQALSIAGVLDSTIDQMVQGLGALENSKAAARACRKLGLLQEVGLGYLKLGQPITTLSGGECQRLKLASHLADFGSRAASGKCLFLFDEPTTGLHPDDVRQLIDVFQRLVSKGHSVLVIEHNLDVIRSADWIIDLGPEAGAAGGEVLAAAPPGQLAAHRTSHTAAALRTLGSHLDI